MTKLQIPRPASDEMNAYYHDYVAMVPDQQISRRMTEQIHEVDALLGPLDDAAALARYAEGKWSIKDVVGHVIDTERVFSCRLLRISRGDATPLPAFDENAYVPAGRFDERSLADLQTDFRATRSSTIALVESVPMEYWSRRGHVSGHPISARAIAYILVGHVAHHLMILRDRYGLRAISSVPQS